jgi:hypothetical protein
MIDFSKEERYLIAYFTKKGDRQWEQLSHSAVILAPLLGFAVYGIIRQDCIALAIAFFGFFLFEIWHFFSTAQYSKSLHSLCKKLEEYERVSAGRV